MMFTPFKRLAVRSHSLEALRSLRTTATRRKRPAAIHVALANEYFAEIQREKDNIDIELNDIVKRISPHYEISDVPTNALVCLTSKDTAESIARVQVKFHCQNSEEIGVDEEEMEKRLKNSLKNDLGSAETDNGGDMSMVDGPSDSEVGIHFVVTIAPVSAPHAPLILDCFASESLRVLRLRGLVDDASAFAWSGRITGEGGPLSPVAPRRRKDLPPPERPPSPEYMFSSLKAETQTALLALLKELRVDDDLSFFVLAYGRAKEQEQYLQFLEQLVHFTDRGIDLAALGLSARETSPKKPWK